jgi:hypothetical protein
MQTTARCLLLGLFATFVAPAAVAQTAGRSTSNPVRLETLRDIHLAMEICWRANLPPPAQATPGMRVTVRVSFTRIGEILGEPLFTFATPGVPAETRARYQRAAAAALARCTPLPFTDSLGNAVAGTPRVFVFIDRRNEKRA